MSNRIDDELRQVLDAYVQVTPDPPALDDIVMGPARVPAIRRWSAPRAAVVAALATLAVVGSVALLRSGPEDAVGGADDAATVVPSDDPESLLDQSALVVLGSGEDWSLAAYAAGGGFCHTWTVGGLSLEGSWVSEAAAEDGICAPSSTWDIPEVLLYEGAEEEYEAGARGDLCLIGGECQHAAAIGLVDDSVASIVLEFSGGSTVELTPFGEDDGLGILGYFHRYEDADVGSLIAISAFDDEGRLLGKKLTP